jgi:hypothetical protein
LRDHRIPYFENGNGTPAKFNPVPKPPGPNGNVALEDRIQIQWLGGVYGSKSYDQQIEGSSRRDDTAMIVKVQSPWSPQHRILIVAGIRGIGTWGAAECMKKWWEELYHQKGSSKKRGTTKSGDFAALVKVHYEGHDIKDRTPVIHLEDLEPEIPSSAGR